jgi:hypothetical protein
MIPISLLSVVVRVVHILDNVAVLVRAYGKGSELIIDRKQELIVSGSGREWVGDTH